MSKLQDQHLHWKFIRNSFKMSNHRKLSVARLDEKDGSQLDQDEVTQLDGKDLWSLDMKGEGGGGGGGAKKSEHYEKLVEYYLSKQDSS